MACIGLDLIELTYHSVNISHSMRMNYGYEVYLVHTPKC